MMIPKGMTFGRSSSQQALHIASELSGHLAESAGLRPVFLLAAVNFCVVAVLNGLARRHTVRDTLRERGRGR